MPEANDPVIVNTGPLLALGACDGIELLEALHSRVIVPQAVVVELERGRWEPTPRRPHVTLPEWFEVLQLQQPISPLLQAHLDEGEASVIALALELSFRLVLIDEKRGRIVARTMGLDVTGSVGILLRARRLGLLDAVKPRLEAMQSQGVWLSKRLIDSALQEAGEE